MSHPDEKINTLLTIMRHREELTDGIESLVQDLRQRARKHDRSKIRLGEFEGFSQINGSAREHPYGSDGYREALKSQRGPDGCLTLHFSRNSHHPEYYDNPANMTFMDIIEMVIDWNAAVKTYGTNTLSDSLEVQRERLQLPETHWWLIEQVVSYLETRP